MRPSRPRGLRRRLLSVRSVLRTLRLLVVLLLLAPHAARAQEYAPVLVRAALVDEDGDHVPDRLGEPVEVVGTLVADPLDIANGAALSHLHDRSGGIGLYSPDDVLVQPFALGDSVRVRGRIGQFRGAEQLWVDEVDRLGTGTVPPPHDVLVSEVKTERLSGRLVRVAGEILVSENEDGTISVEVSDRSGRVPVFLPRRFFNDPDLVGRLRSGGEAEIVGIASQYDEEPPFDSGYQIVPRSPKDLSLSPVPPYRTIAVLVGFVVLSAAAVFFSLRRRSAERRALELEQLARELREAKTELERERIYLRGVIDATPNGVFVKDGEGRFTLVNRAMANFYGLPPAEVIGRTDLELGFPREAAEAYLATDREVIRTGRSLSIETETAISPRTGEPGWYDTRKVPLDDPGGERHVLGVVTDVTARRHTEEKIRRQSAAMDASMDGMAILGADGRYVYANRAHAEIYGYADPEELIGAHWKSLYHEEEWRRIQEAVSPALERGEGWRGEATGRKRDGSAFPHELSLTTLEGGGTVCVIRDITARKQLEEQLRQAQKMEAVGRLAGGVAHDFNNLLLVIRGNVSLALQSLPEDDERHEDLLEVERASERAADLVSHLLAFSRSRVILPEVLDVNAVIARTEKMLRRLIGHDVELLTRLDPAVGRVRADAGQLEQVLVNLAVNARDAMEEGGTLLLHSRNATAVEGPPGGAGPDARYVVIEVSDTGRGIDAATMERIFDPFFTTKEQGKGTGLGLSIVYGIVEQHGGFVDLESREGEGTTFRVYLPRTDAPAADPIPAEEPTAGPASGSGTVLVVDDESMVRRLACRVLERSGYTVLQGGDGQEALALAASHPGTIDLLLTDVAMPRMGGWELAERMAAIDPALPIVFMSGYAEPPGDRAGRDPGRPLLTKPFHPASLVEVVRQALAAVRV